MARITDEDLRGIIDTERDTAPFIATATLRIDEELVSKGLSAARLQQIELYLAAHYVAITEPVLQSVGNSGDNMTYQLPTAGTGLAATPYGLQALALDTSGTLAATLQLKAAIFEVI
jgi:hypothetical protein